MFYNINATESVNDVLKFAGEIAQKYNNSQIATEHLLYGILSIQDCLATRLLKSYGVSRKEFLLLLSKEPKEYISTITTIKNTSTFLQD